MSAEPRCVLACTNGAVDALVRGHKEAFRFGQSCLHPYDVCFYLHRGLLHGFDVAGLCIRSFVFPYLARTSEAFSDRGYP